MSENMPSIVEDRIPAHAPVDFDGVEDGKSYIMKVENPETGEMVEVEVTVMLKSRNETTDGSPGAKILAYQFKVE